MWQNSVVIVMGMAFASKNTYLASSTRVPSQLFPLNRSEQLVIVQHGNEKPLTNVLFHGPQVKSASLVYPIDNLMTSFPILSVTFSSRLELKNLSLHQLSLDSLMNPRNGRHFGQRTCIN
ncbi:hypothetical protein CVT26_005440 [Gymnopilus dilepis]|uniref:Uncharacterized protein n=1 Tax=Gymnopilus dilepis TaxID=231916 RepID=A0A409WC30_9AGAR|nr:hypothetical protein CVT26_005440 [Gymnopilus dilepis]